MIFFLGCIYLSLRWNWSTFTRMQYIRGMRSHLVYIRQFRVNFLQTMLDVANPVWINIITDDVKYCTGIWIWDMGICCMLYTIYYIQCILPMYYIYFLFYLLIFKNLFKTNLFNKILGVKFLRWYLRFATTFLIQDNLFFVLRKTLLKKYFDLV